MRNKGTAQPYEYPHRNTISHCCPTTLIGSYH